MARNQAAKKYAEGTPDEPVLSDVPPPMETQPDYSAQLPDQPVGAVPEPRVAADAGDALASTDEAPALQLATAPPAEPTAPEEMAPEAPAAAQAPAKPKIITPLHIANDLPAETQLRMQDIASGDIHAKTFADMLPKSTMGKIGTYFGILLGGIGSGLTHQPNMVLEMMNKAIDRDLEAQKSSKSNQQNLYKLNLEHINTQTQALRTKYENELTEAQTKGMPAEIALKRKQIDHLDADNKVLADTHTRNGLQLGYMKELNTLTANLAPGQHKQSAEVALNGVTKAGMGDIAKRNAETQAKINFGSSLNGNYQEGTPQQEESFKHVQQLRRLAGQPELAKDAEDKHLPHVPGSSSTPLVQADRDRVQSSQELMGGLKRLRDFAVAHPNPLPHSPEDVEGKSLAAQVSSLYRAAIGGGVYKEGEQHFINGIVPGDPTSWNPFAQVPTKIDALMKETAARNQSFLHNKGFEVELPKSSGGKSAEKPAGEAKGGGEQIMQDKSGQKWIVKDGKTVGRAP